MVIEGTDNDISNAPGISGSTEVLMLRSEGLVNDDKSIPMFFPITGQFNWNSVANGNLGQETTYAFTQHETIFFRVASATTEPTISLVIPNISFVVVGYDGLPLPEPIETDTVVVGGGGRVEFLVRFDEPGTYEMSRLGWPSALPQTVEACLEFFGINAYPCISYDKETLAATILVSPANSTIHTPTSLLEDIELPPVSEKLRALAETESVDSKTILLQQKSGFPLFQVPYNGPFVPPGIGFGMNDHLATPHFFAGNVTAGTCETWDVVSLPGALEHPFHSHSAHFLVTHMDGIAVNPPVWHDTFPIFGENVTIHICFHQLQPGETMLVHCHMPNHLDIGMAMSFRLVENPNDIDMGAKGLSRATKCQLTFISLLVGYVFLGVRSWAF
jgi:FtsP/CotA-like multicopper oxidase with cupredoxin domain